MTKISTYDEDPDLPSSETLLKEVFQTYDVFNRWITREVDSDGDSTIDSETIFVYDGDQIVLELDGDQAADLTHRYLWGPVVDQIFADEVVSDLENEGDVLWPLTDNLGTVRDLAEYDDATDETTIVDHYVYDAFGNETDHTGSNDFLFKYTGRAFDEETGLQNNLNRWFDPAVGRWLSEDPIGFAAGDANVYRYVGNFATGAMDPSGLAVSSSNKPPVGKDWKLKSDTGWIPTGKSQQLVRTSRYFRTMKNMNDSKQVTSCYLQYVQEDVYANFVHEQRIRVWERENEDFVAMQQDVRDFQDVIDDVADRRVVLAAAAATSFAVGKVLADTAVGLGAAVRSNPFLYTNPYTALYANLAWVAAAAGAHIAYMVGAAITADIIMLEVTAKAARDSKLELERKLDTIDEMDTHIQTEYRQRRVKDSSRIHVINEIRIPCSLAD